MLKKRSGSAMMSAIFMLGAMVIITMIVLDMLNASIVRRRAEGNSAKAFYAAEAGIERAMLAFRKEATSSNPNDATGCLGAEMVSNSDNYVLSDTGKCASDNGTNFYIALDNQSSYSYRVKVLKGQDNNLTIKSQGRYSDTYREVQATFCLPKCVDRDGVRLSSNGCGGDCPTN